MTRTVPADARLNANRAGQPVGYRVLHLDRSPFRAFTRSGVVEPLPGYFVADGGAPVPAAGGWIVWGIETEDYAWSTVEPVPVDGSKALLAEVGRLLDALLVRITAAMPKPVAVDLQPLAAEMVALRTDLRTDLRTGLAETTLRLETQQVAETQQAGELQKQLTDLVAALARLDRLNEAANEFDRVNRVAAQINDSLASAPSALRVMAGHASDGVTDPAVLRRITELQEKVKHLADVPPRPKQPDEKRLRSVAALDKFLATVEGAI